MLVGISVCLDVRFFPIFRGQSVRGHVALHDWGWLGCAPDQKDISQEHQKNQSMHELSPDRICFGPDFLQSVN